MKGGLKNKRILITYGPTWVAIDRMRIISNQSSGEMGKCLIADLIKTGAKITALEGPIREPLKNKNVTLKKFTFFDEFAKIFKTEIKKNYDIVIHAAAVSDFRPANRIQKKIASDKPIALTLIPTKKLIRAVKRLSPKSVLVGFKLGSTACVNKLQCQAAASIKMNQCDFVIANNLTNGYTGFLFNKKEELLAHGRSRKMISRQLCNQLLEHFSAH